jgi:GT2 family glycosyltransferase
METHASPPALAAIVANWNGEAFIERCLGSLLAAVRRAGVPIEVIVYDDASDDGSPDRIARAFPSVRLIRGTTNLGFGGAVNRAMSMTDAQHVFLLNNDLALAADFCVRLLETHAQCANPERLLAIGARTRDWESGVVNHGGQRAAWIGGLVCQEPFEADAAAPADFFQAGACLIDRRKFLQLGGFCPLYAPGYWEDYDLAWQGRARGWSVLYEPRAVAWHLGKGSMRRRLGSFGLSLVLRRNHLLFNWLNLRRPGRLVAHLTALPRRVALDRPPADQAGWGRALLALLPRLPAILAERRRRARHPPVPGG